MFSLHERGLYQTLYFATYLGSTIMGTMIAGPRAEYIGWRNFLWLNGALHIVTFLMCLFSFPETKWHRPHPNEIRQMTSQAASPFIEQETPPSALASSGAEKVDSRANLNTLCSAYTPADPYLGNSRPNKRYLKLYQANKHLFKSILLHTWIPWSLHFHQ